MKRPGLTFIELLISLSVLGLIITVASSLFISTGQFSSDEQLRIDVGESAGRVIGPLDQILREAKIVVASAIVDGITYTSDENTLVFTLPSLDSNGATIANADDIGVITLDPTNPNFQTIDLFIRPGNGTFRAAQSGSVVEHVKDLYIRYTDDVPENAQAATLTVQVTKQVRGRTYTRSNILYAVFRNHP